MLCKLKTLVLVISLIFNGLVIALLVSTAASKSHSALLSFPAVENGYSAAAAIAILPASSSLGFHPIEVALKPAQKTIVQYSVFIERKQSNMLLNALYDPQIVSVEYSGAAIVITALREGETLLQYIANDGIKDLIKVIVAK